MCVCVCVVRLYESAKSPMILPPLPNVRSRSLVDTCLDESSHSNGLSLMLTILCNKQQANQRNEWMS